MAQDFLFEKQGPGRDFFSTDVKLYTVVVVAAAAYIAYATCVLYDVFGGHKSVDNVSAIDLLNILGQLATAGAFIFGVVQYRITAKQKRQMDLAAEAKLQVVKMIEVIEGVHIGTATNLRNLDSSLTQLSNLGANFETVFHAMDEDIQKAIVRMHWQDMFFNKMVHALATLDIQPIVERKVSNASLNNAIQKASAASNDTAVLPVFRDYIFIKTLLNDPMVKPFFTLEGKLSSLDVFIYHFLNDSNLNEHFYGLLSRVDVRSYAPLLAVAGPSEWALKSAVKQSD